VSRRTKTLFPHSRDGTSQRSRRLPALDSSHVLVDERSDVDVLRFVSAYAEQLHSFNVDPATDEVITNGTWADFASRTGLSVADVVAYTDDPSRFSAEARRWLGRPHFALLLTFVKLLSHARDQLNAFTRRHLDHYYRDVLALEPELAVADRATVLFGLRPSSSEVLVRAGTALAAGRDANNVPRIYRTERDIVVNHASVVEQRSVYVDRRITGIPDVRKDRDLTAPAALIQSLGLALGSPNPGDPIPKWNGHDVDVPFLITLKRPLDFARARLFLEHHELRSLMRLYRRRRDADAEWAEINRLLRVTSPPNPRDFLANVTAAVGPLDFASEGLPQVSNIDDLYTYRDDHTDADGDGNPDVRAFIDAKFVARGISFDDFVALMQIKLRIDAEWKEINRLLERIGRRQRNVLEWTLPSGVDPTNFNANLAAALGPMWPPTWPSTDITNIDDYDTLLRRLEAHFSMSVERLQTLIAFAREVSVDAASENHDWSDIDRILADAHREKVYAARRAELARIRADVPPGQPPTTAFDNIARHILASEEPIAWDDAKVALSSHLERSQLELLARFRQALADGTSVAGFGWTEAERLFELAWRSITQLPEPIAQVVEVHNVYAYANATTVRDNESPGWKTFGGRPAAVNAEEPRGAMLGWALRSPLLSLSEGARTITITFGLTAKSFKWSVFRGHFGLRDEDRSGTRLTEALSKWLRFEVTTKKEWVELALQDSRIALGTAADNYWTLAGLTRPAAEDDRAALQLTFRIGKQIDALAPVGEQPHLWPTLQVVLKPVFFNTSEAKKEWRTKFEAFEPLALAATHLQVAVAGLSTLRLQHEDRVLDSRKPFEPFGNRPAVGSRLYLDHPELVRARLGLLTFDLEWMGVPDSLVDGTLTSHYANYPGPISASTIKTKIVLVDQNVELALHDTPLFEDADGRTKSARTLRVDDVGASVSRASPTFIYESRYDAQAADDIRRSTRYLELELTPLDLGHGIYPALVQSTARKLAIAMAGGGVIPDADKPKYQINPPYTPKLKRLTVGYTTSVEVKPDTGGADELLHVHPFGVSRIDPTTATLLPAYSAAGELYIGIRHLHPPQHLTLLLQLAEGTSDPDIEAAPVTWSYLSGNRFIELSDGALVLDSTRGLINSGIVELALPAPMASTRLPANVMWLRVAVARNPRCVCDVVAIRAQAVSAIFEDRGNAASHYEQPLPAGSIERLLDPDVRVASIEQPYTSYGGMPPERADTFDTRVSERLRHKQRALSSWDYERLVLQRFRQIYKAKCLSVGDGGVEVLVIPDIRALTPGDTFAPRAPANLLADIQSYLVSRAPAVARVRVRNAHYVPVKVRLGVRFMTGIDVGFAKQRLTEDLVKFLSPWAFEEGAELMIGGRIYANSILDFVDRRDYIDYVAEIKLFRSIDGGANFDLIPPTVRDYHVATQHPDQVLVAAQQHLYDVIPDTGYEQANFTGINYARIELDFIVG
jgi:hypothetical protein